MKKVIITVMGTLALFSCKKKAEIEACLTSNKSEILVNDVVQFENCSDNYLTAEWDFGDGTESEIANTSHRYTETGEYITRLRVLDEEGNTSEAATTVKVYEAKLNKITVEHPDLSSPDFTWNLNYNSSPLFNNNQIEIDTITETKFEFSFKNSQQIIDQDIVLTAIKYETDWWNWDIIFQTDFYLNAHKEVEIDNLKITKIDSENDLKVNFDYEISL